MAVTYEPIATTTLGSAAASYTFSSIPATYTDLVLIFNGGTSTNNTNYYIRFNGDTATNYSYTYIQSDGTTANSSRASTVAYLYVASGSKNALEDVVLINVNNYANTSFYKSALARYALATGTGSRVQAYVGTWRSTAAITSLTFSSNGSNLLTGCTLTLYGIKAA